jgi:hypothetical protein
MPESSAPTRPELTIFATPKPFRGIFDRIQRNAAWSWAQLGPQAEVLLIGDDEGTREVSRALGVRHLPDVARSPKNVPLLDDLWSIGQREASAQTCVFVNADIVLTDDILVAVAKVHQQIDGPFLAVGQRWDLELDQDLRSAGGDASWMVDLRRRAQREGRLNSPLWVDWFAFPRGQYPELPSFVVGRPGYDHWLVWHTLTRDIPVIDATDAVIAVHQHHDYSHGGDHRNVWFGEDAARNRVLIGDRSHMRHIGHAGLRLRADLVLEPARGAKYRLSRAHTRLGPVLERTAELRHRYGLDAERLQSLGTRVRRTKLPAR